MGNEANLKPFTKENQPPAEKKSRKGIPNRATVIKRLMKIKTQVADPANPKGQPLTVTLHEAAALGQFLSAMKGNTNAWKEIQDTLHGKMPDKIEQESNVTGKILVEFVKANDSNGTDNDTDQG